MCFTTKLSNCVVYVYKIHNCIKIQIKAVDVCKHIHSYIYIFGYVQCISRFRMFYVVVYGTIRMGK